MVVTIMRQKLKGLTKVSKALASGKTVIYCYAWRGGPLLKDKAGNPLQPDDPSLPLAFAAAYDERRNPKTNDLTMLVRQYRASTDFRTTALTTQHEYSTYLDIIRDAFGSLSLEQLQDTRTRGKFKEWRDKMAATPRKADFAWAVLARVLSFGKDRGVLTTNIAERGGRIYRPDRREMIWTDGHVSAFEAVAPTNMRLALQLALWTGQRKGDLLRLRWRDYDGECLRLSQSKTKSKVIVPLHPNLRQLLHPKKPMDTILINSLGNAWTVDGFNTSWRKLCAEARIVGLNFHDLRGTAATRMALAGCTVPEIAAVTGHSLRDVETILDLHYLGGRAELATSAMRKMAAVNA
jgi:integrase